MTRKQATIAVRSGLNDDEQYGCVVPADPPFQHL
ncbi:Cystathionine gamma-synthase [Raoultella terrigena]|uniref:Cystathionine gamma-synthase n=1 Tax=Raoultella terrigena TaxID=577 RepID=A0A4U9D9S4_RAOTE|nr:Cystathionine gamma-synthase [Raoultella terrigena]